jgi:hypothetical protein
MKFETLYQELKNSTETIRTLLAGISQEEARVKPTPETWSLLEVTCHLYDEECEDFREHLDFILHRQNETWHTIRPTEWVVERKYNEQNFEEMRGKFFLERKQSLDWLTDLSNANWDIAYTTKFGIMTAGDMFASWIAHDNLHIRQLVEVRRSRIEAITTPCAIDYAGDW